MPRPQIRALSAARSMKNLSSAVSHRRTDFFRGVGFCPSEKKLSLCAACFDDQAFPCIRELPFPNPPSRARRARRPMNAMSRAYAPGREDRIAKAPAKRDRKNAKWAREASPCASKTT
jgi:hypothetical protein